MTVEIKRLEGWLSLTETAEELGMTRQGLHYLVFVAQDFDPNHIRAVDDRPTYIFRTSAVKAKKAERQQEAAEREADPRRG